MLFRGRPGWKELLAPCVLVLLVASCGGGGDTTPSGSPSSTPSGNPVPNSAPTLSGQPPATAAVGSAYVFLPTAQDANNDALAFSIDNKPGWAQFSASSGGLTGTPTLADVGTYANIVIHVSDGKASTALPSFTIVVSGTGNGTATLSWAAPTQNINGTTLVDLGGFWIYHGTDAAMLTRLHQVTSASTTSFVATGLSSGVHYFAVSAYNAGNVESPLSNVGSKSVP
jgi:hypothetical protein